jgi:elongation factor Ts
MAFTANDVKTLREQTGVGMMDCKKALVATDGDMEKALEHLRKQGMASAGKKAGRITAEGLICSHVSDDGGLGVLMELNCETDFVARNDDFQNLASKLVHFIAETNPADVDTLVQAKIGDATVESLINESVQKLGENISLRRFVRQESPNGFVCSYIHGGGKLGVLLELVPEDNSKRNAEELVELAKDLAMQVAASAPAYLCSADVPTEVVEKELEIYREVLRKEGKKEEMLDKIAQGKLSKFYQDFCLVDQPFVKESKSKVQQHVDEIGKKIGTKIAIKRFSRFVLGDGVEKK